MMYRFFAALSLLITFGLMGSACEYYDSPPRIEVVNLVDGLLQDPRAPITLRFSEQVKPESLRVKIAVFETDDEGNLFDEDPSDATNLNLIYLYEQNRTQGGSGVLSADGRSLTMTLDNTLPVGPRLVLIVEPGLSDLEGRTTKVRNQVEFGFVFECVGSALPEFFETGAYFFVVDVEKPVETQVQLYAWLDIDQETGLINGQFTNADRILDPNRCDPPCADTEVCRTVPSMKCVLPSDVAGSPDEYPDYYANNITDTGFSFTVQACAQVIEEGVVGFGNAPVDIKVPVPDLTIVGIDLSSAFKVDAAGVVRGSGSFTADTVFLTVIDSGPGTGTLIARRVPDEDIPENFPKPPPLPTTPGTGTGTDTN